MIPYKEKESYEMADLLEIVRLLRSPDGCPWDKVQTHASMRKELIEETYEVIEAIDREDPAMLREELGDVLLQVVFHSQIAAEDNQFQFADVVNAICHKLLERHPHVFGSIHADTPEQALKSWDAAKAHEKSQTTRTQKLESVAKTLPSLMRAQKIYKRLDAALTGEELLEKMMQCLDRLQNSPADSKALGEMLFCGTALAQKEHSDAEQSLTDFMKHFVSRFEEAERQALEQGENIAVTANTWTNFAAEGESHAS